MSIRMAIAIAAGLGAVIALAGGAGAEMFAPAKTGKAPTVNFVGCAVRAGDCVFIKNGGKTYNITSAAPANLGLKLRVSGTETDKQSTCQGIILDNLKVSQTKQPCKMPKK
jgi:hypothetical protein